MTQSIFMTTSNHSIVDFFREAAPYIHMHRGKTFIIALSGEAILHKRSKALLNDIAILSTLGVRIVITHGCRPQIDQELAKENHAAKVVNGLRVTDNKTLEIIKTCIGATRLEIENRLHQALNRPPVVNNSLGVISGNFITAKPVGIIDGIDYLHTGKVRKVNHQQLKSLLQENNIVLVSPLGNSPTGQMYNILLEEVVEHLAINLDASKLIFIHDNQKFSLLPRHCSFDDLSSRTKNEHTALLSSISKAIHQGLERVHFIEVDSDGGLLLELFTRDGVGSMLSTNRYDTPRTANETDINGIINLIKPLEIEGVLAKRSRTEIELDIHKFSVIERDGLIIGCAALYADKSSNTGELSCLVIHKDYQSGNRGGLLVDYIKEKATVLGLETLYILTTQSIDWFLEKGFKEKRINSLPTARQHSYNKNRSSKVLSIKLNNK